MVISADIQCLDEACLLSGKLKSIRRIAVYESLEA